MGKILTEVSSGVATVTLNDPDKRNALDAEFARDLAAAINDLDTSPEVHAIILTGSGKAFCAGANLGSLAQATEKQTDTSGLEERREGYAVLYEPFLTLRSARVPTIAAVNGAAVGAGLNLVLAADVAIAGSSAKFMSGFLRLGLHPGGGNTSMLTDRVGPQGAAAITLFGDVCDGREAERIGLVYRCVSDDSLLGEARRLAETAARQPSAVTMRVKETLALAGHADFATVLAAEVTAQIWSTTLPETAERLAAMRQR